MCPLGVCPWFIDITTKREHFISSSLTSRISQDIQFHSFLLPTLRSFVLIHEPPCTGVWRWGLRSSLLKRPCMSLSWKVLEIYLLKEPWRPSRLNFFAFNTWTRQVRAMASLTYTWLNYLPPQKRKASSTVPIVSRSLVTSLSKTDNMHGVLLTAGHVCRYCWWKLYRYRHYLSDSPSHFLLNKMEGKNRKGKFLSRSQLLQFSYLPL